MERSEPAPPRGRVAVLAGRRRRREPLQRRGSAIPQPSPRRLHPPFELRRIAQIEAVQERPRVELRGRRVALRSEEHTSELQSRLHLVCRLLLEKKKK